MSAVLLAFALTSFFIFPQADDFSYASRVLEFGMKEAQISEYMKWNGRFSATAFLSVSPLVWGKLFHYRLAPILLLILIYLSFVFLMTEMFSTKLKGHEKWYFALALTFLSVTGMHTTAEGLYWYASSYSYTIAIVFFNVSFSLLLSEKKTSLKYALASLSALILTGCNETSMVIWMYTVGVIGLLTLKEKKKLPLGLIAVFIVSAIGALIMLKSPGNAIRAGYFEKSHNVVRTVSNALLYSFIDPFKFLTLPLVCFAFLNRSRLLELLAGIGRRKELIFILLGLFFISFAPSLWGMGRRPNPRTMNVIFHAYLLVIFPLFATWTQDLKGKDWVKFLVAGLLLSVPTFNLSSDYLLGKIQAYDGMWREEVATNGLYEAEKKNIPYSIHFSFIEANELHFLKFKSARSDFYQ